MNKELLYSFFEGKTMLHEEMRIRKWMESSSENYRIFMEERKLFDAMMLLTNDKDLSSSSSLFKQKLRLIGRELGKIAAVITLTLLTAYGYHSLVAEKTAIAMQRITVPAGQRINIELADGTVVWLNSRTTIQYPAIFNGDTRSVKIDGEAYFEVAHNPKKPFIVTGSKGSVEVLGTKFYIEDYADNEIFVASLIDGAVKVSNGKEKLNLKPAQLAYLKDGKLYTQEIDDYNVYRWREGLICFKNESFTNIMKKFEKCYGVTIQIENQRVFDYRCSGKFRQSDGILYALRVLQKDVKFEVVRDEDDHIIYIK